MKPDPIDRTGDEQAQRAAYLIAGYIRQTLSEEEHDELDEWITSDEENQRLFEELTDPRFLEEGLHSMDQSKGDDTHVSIRKHLAFTKKRKARIRRLVPYGIAASIILLIFFLTDLDLMMRKSRTKKVVHTAAVIEPGGNKAYLSLGDGRIINLDSIKNGLIDASAGAEVLKAADGQLNYENVSSTSSVFHTLTTPPGGQYSVALPDGSRAWLNASSQLKYPVVFSNDKRVVELQGEGYFEVNKKTTVEKPVPFIVKAGELEVEVLGTSFNINAYRDELVIKTTLLEGKIRLRHPTIKDHVELEPRQQASVSSQGESTIQSNVNTEEIIAWKNGLFKFTDAPIEVVMRQVSRWYGAEIIYKDKINYHFNATIYRHEHVNKLLDLLAETGRVHFKIEGKKITVGK